VSVSEKRLSRAARIKLARSAKRTARKRAIKKRIRAKRMKTTDQLKKVADKTAKNIIVKKMTGGKKYSNLSLSQKEMIDKKLVSKKAVLNKISRKLMPVVKLKEKERLKRVRNKENEKVNESSVLKKHGVYTLSVNDSKLEVSARYVNGKLKPFCFKDKKEALNHTDKVGGKIFHLPKKDLYYVEFTKLDGPINEKANSKSQQRLFGMVHAYNNGELEKTDVGSGLYAKIEKIASGMTKKDAKKLAKTKHDDLPEKVPTESTISEQISYKTANEIKKQWKQEYPNDKFTFKKVRAKGNEFLMVLSPKGVELERYQFVPKTGWTEMNENKENEEDVKELKAMLDIAQMLSDQSPYFKGRGSKKEYIKMLVHKIKKLSESKKKKLMTKLDAYKKVRKETLPKSRPMKSKKSYDRKDFKKGKYD
jgi:hypothetical protein